MSRRWLATLREFFTHEQRDADLARELDAHLAAEAEEQVAGGTPPDEARFAARRALGNPTTIRERTRDAWTWGRVVLTLRDLTSGLHQDLRYALRTFAKQRGFTGAAVLALGLGIGATTTIYSVIHGVLLDPYPMYREVDRIVGITVVDLASARPGGRSGFQTAEFLDYKAQATSFSEVIAGGGDDVLWRTPQGTEQWAGGFTSGNTFSFMGAGAAIGRTLTIEDERPGAPPVFVMGHKLWTTRFGQDPSVVNRVFTLNGAPTTLVGVMPERISKLGADVWLPQRLDRADRRVAHRFWRFQARLKPGISVADAEAELNTIARSIAPHYPRLYPERFAIRVETIIDGIVGQFRTTLYMMAAAVGMLLLIACINVANMLLSRAADREQEMAVRSSLGANRLRLVRQLMIESLLLAFAGAGLGCLIAYGGTALVSRSMPDGLIPRESVIRLEPEVLLFCLVVAGATAIVFGLMPALQTARRQLTPALRDGGKGTGGGFRRSRLSHALVVGEIALALVLLSAAGLLMRSFIKMQASDLGFDPEQMLVVRIPGNPTPRTLDEQQALLAQALARVRALPGVVGATSSNGVPPFGGFTLAFDIPGADTARRRSASVEMVSDDYFRTLRIRLLRGRGITADDVAGRRAVAVVNERLAEQHFPGVDPIGRSVALRLPGVPETTPPSSFQIVGVVADARNRSLPEPIAGGVYLPTTVEAVRFSLLIRTAGPPMAMAETIKRELWAQDRSLALADTGAIGDYIQRFQYARPRLGLVVFGSFAAVGLLLVVLGVASLVAYTVARQSREIGIRLAIGASHADVLRLTVGMGLRWLAYGVAIGLAGSLATTRLLAAELLEISPRDPLTLAVGVAVIAVSGALASYVPARRATRIDPIVVLRSE
jgi:putative ABC transport system permease protein